jgi:uncharacterized membrane protein YbhN (UPF0104 family)
MYVVETWRRRIPTILRAAPVVLALIALPFVVDLRSLGALLAQVAPVPLGLAVLVNLLTRAAASERNLTLLRAGNLGLSRGQALESLFISNFWGLVLPGVSAGAVATVMRYRHHGVPAPQALAVLTASRLLELAAFTVLAIVGWLLSSGTPAAGALFDHGYVIAGLVAAGTVLRQLRPTSLAGGFGWATVQGLLDAATVTVLARAIGIELDLAHALWINALAYFAILLPLSVAGLGVREAAVVFALVPLGYSREAAVALALLMLSMTLVNSALGGALHARAVLWSDRRAQSKA